MIFRSKKSLCFAPFVSLTIGIDGQASPCCYTQRPANQKASGAETGSVIRRIWNGPYFEYFRENLSGGIFPDECYVCGQYAKDRTNSGFKPAMYNEYGCKKRSFPSLIEITVDNICNLSCTMCNSTYSSAIAARNKIHRPAFDKEALIGEILANIRKVDEIIISGGEPFLSPVSTRFMQDIVNKKPGCKISVNTNATILNQHIREIIEKGNFKFNASVDSFRKETYEQIRVGAGFENTMKNLEYFAEYSTRRKVPLSIVVCPLTLNYDELPELTDYCTSRGFEVFFVHVFNAHHVSLASADIELLNKAIDLYSSARLKAGSELGRKNNQQFQGLKYRIENRRLLALKKLEFSKKYQASTNDLTSFISAQSLKIGEYLKNSGQSEQARLRIEKWESVFRNVVSGLPGYFSNSVILNRFSAFSPELLLYYGEETPVEELKQTLQSFSDNIISTLPE